MEQNVCFKRMLNIGGDIIQLIGMPQDDGKYRVKIQILDFDDFMNHEVLVDEIYDDFEEVQWDELEQVLESIENRDDIQRIALLKSIFTGD